MSSDRPDPSEFLAQAQRMLRELFGDSRSSDEEEPWSAATRSARESRGPSAEQQRENLTFALATRAVEALEDLRLNVAAIRQRLARTGAQPGGRRPEGGGATDCPRWAPAQCTEVSSAPMVVSSPCPVWTTVSPCSV